MDLMPFFFLFSSICLNSLYVFFYIFIKKKTSSLQNSKWFIEKYSRAKCGCIWCLYDQKTKNTNLLNIWIKIVNVILMSWTQIKAFYRCVWELCGRVVSGLQIHCSQNVSCWFCGHIECSQKLSSSSHTIYPFFLLSHE